MFTKKKNKISYLKPEDKITLNGTSCILDNMDWECNIPPLGFLWVRKYKDVSHIPGYVKEGPAEAIGIVGIVSRRFYPVTNANEFDSILVSVPDLTTLSVLYDLYLKPPTLTEKVVAFFKKLLMFK